MTTNAVEVMNVMIDGTADEDDVNERTDGDVAIVVLFCFVLLLFRDSDQDERPRWEECRDDEEDNDEAR